MDMRTVLLVWCAGWAVGCYGSEEPGTVGASGLEQGDDVSALADVERIQLCDWGVSIGAVTGQDTDCTNEVIESPTQPECVQALQQASARPTCTYTVAQVEACFTTMAADPCTGYHDQVCATPAGCE